MIEVSSGGNFASLDHSGALSASFFMQVPTSVGWWSRTVFVLGGGAAENWKPQILERSGLSELETVEALDGYCWFTEAIREQVLCPKKSTALTP
jgi:hypothetical protein